MSGHTSSTRLTPEELESLREEAARDSAWAKAELERLEPTKLSSDELESLRQENSQAIDWAMAELDRLEPKP